METEPEKTPESLSSEISEYLKSISSIASSLSRELLISQTSKSKIVSLQSELEALAKLPGTAQLPPSIRLEFAEFARKSAERRRVTRPPAVVAPARLASAGEEVFEVSVQMVVRLGSSGFLIQDENRKLMRLRPKRATLEPLMCEVSPKSQLNPSNPALPRLVSAWPRGSGGVAWSDGLQLYECLPSSAPGRFSPPKPLPIPSSCIPHPSGRLWLQLHGSSLSIFETTGREAARLSLPTGGKQPFIHSEGRLLFFAGSEEPFSVFWLDLLTNEAGKLEGTVANRAVEGFQESKNKRFLAVEKGSCIEVFDLKDKKRVLYRALEVGESIRFGGQGELIVSSRKRSVSVIGWRSSMDFEVELPGVKGVDLVSLLGNQEGNPSLWGVKRDRKGIVRLSVAN